MKRRDKDNRPKGLRKQKHRRPGGKCECGHWGGHYASDHMGPNGEGVCSHSLAHPGPPKKIKASCDCKRFRAHQ